MTENNQQHSSFENSLLYRTFKHVLGEVRSPFNQVEAGKRFHNDPREHPGERLTHYVLTGRAHQAIEEFRGKHPELVYKTLSEKETPIAA